MARTKNKIAPNDERAVVAMDKSAEAIEKATRLYGDGEPFDVERILDCMVFRAEQAVGNTYAFGRYCLWLRESIGWGGFCRALENSGLDVRGAHHAMLQYEKFGDNLGTVAKLGSRKARALTFFTKEEIEKYAKGDDLRGIPHDDVSSMLATELEEEVRRLRKKGENLKDSHKEEVGKLNEIIDGLKIRAEDPMQLTPAQRAHRLIRDTYTREYAVALSEVSTGIRKARSVLADAERTEGIGVQELNEWLNEFVPDSATIMELIGQWQAETENPGPIEDNFNDIITGKLDV
jgi:hypothetical protein